MVELETRYEVQGRPVLIIGWFEGTGTGRLVVVGPNRVREETQVSLESSLRDEVQQALAEPPPGPRPQATVKVHLTAVTDEGRVTRATELFGSSTPLDALCLKLLSMAGMMVRAEPLKKIVQALTARCSG